MWIYSQQSHWLNVITVTLMETAGSLHENVTELRNRNVTKLDLWLWAGARALNGNDLPNNNYHLNLMLWCWDDAVCVSLCTSVCVCVLMQSFMRQNEQMSPQSSADEQFLQWTHQYYFLVIIFGSFPSDTKLSRMFLTMSSDDVCMIGSELSSSLCFKICKGDVAGFSFSTSGHFVALFVAIKTNILRQNVMFSHREAAT